MSENLVIIRQGESLREGESLGPLAPSERRGEVCRGEGPIWRAPLSASPFRDNRQPTTHQRPSVVSDRFSVVTRRPTRSRIALRFTGVALLALLAAGCASTSDVQKLQSQINDLQDQVAQLKRTASSKEDVQNVNTRIAEQTETLLKSNTTLVTKVGSIEERLNNNQGSVEQTNYRVDHLVQQLTQAQHDVEELRGSVARLAAAPPTPTPAPTQLGVAPAPSPATPAPAHELNVTPDGGETPSMTYQNAYRDYQKGNYDLAIAGFREFIGRYKDSDLADNAAYWIGESLYSQKKYRESIVQFDSVVNDYPKSEKVPSALLKKGYAYISLGEKAQGIVQLQYVVHEHPKSAEAAKARDELKRLGVETR
jgi:tol-pal system protein YbgF